MLHRYRFVELYYRRSESVRKGHKIPARIETVVIFLPDIRSCVPTRLEWDNLNVKYKEKMDEIIKEGNTVAVDADISNPQSTTAATPTSTTVNVSNAKESSDKNKQDGEEAVEKSVGDTTAIVDEADAAAAAAEPDSTNEKALLLLFLSILKTNYFFDTF